MTHKMSCMIDLLKSNYVTIIYYELHVSGLCNFAVRTNACKTQIKDHACRNTCVSYD